MWAWCSRIAKKTGRGGCADAPARIDCRLKRLLEKAAELRLETSVMFVYNEGRRDFILLVLSEAHKRACRCVAGIGLVTRR